MSTDIRAFSALVLAALAAQGETRTHRVYHIARGYESIETRLQALGGMIERYDAEGPWRQTAAIWIRTHRGTAQCRTISTRRQCARAQRRGISIPTYVARAPRRGIFFEEGHHRVPRSVSPREESPWTQQPAHRTGRGSRVRLRSGPAMLSRSKGTIESVTGASTTMGRVVERRHGDRPPGADAIHRGQEGLNLSTPPDYGWRTPACTLRAIRCEPGAWAVGCPCGCSGRWQRQGGCVIGRWINRRAGVTAVAAGARPSPGRPANGHPHLTRVGTEAEGM